MLTAYSIFFSLVALLALGAVFIKSLAHDTIIKLC